MHQPSPMPVEEHAKVDFRFTDRAPVAGRDARCCILLLNGLNHAHQTIAATTRRNTWRFGGL